MPRPKKPIPQPKKKRRPKGTGSVITRGNRHYGRLRNGGEDQLTEGYDTAAEAEAALDALLAGAVDPRLIPTLQAYWESLIMRGGGWEGRNSAATMNLYETVLEIHVRKTPLGKMRLDEIRKTHCQRWVDKLYSSVGEATARRYGSCLSTVLTEAVEVGYTSDRMENGKFVPGNPAQKLKYRTIPDAASYILSDEELAILPEILYEFSPRLSAMVTVEADTGARPAEVCGMVAESIRDGVWRIDRQRLRSGEVVLHTKSKKIRQIKLTADALSAIEAQGRKRGPVFLNEDGKPVRPDAYYTHIYRFRKMLERKDAEAAAKEGREPYPIPHLTPTNLRRTFITRGVETGNVKATQAAAGHSTSKTTLDVYAKARRDPQSALIDALEMGIKRQVWKDKGTDKGTDQVSDSNIDAA